MTREEKLYSMRLVDLALVAESLGIKIDKKGKKETAVNKILVAEAKLAETTAEGEQNTAEPETVEAEVVEIEVTETTAEPETVETETAEETTAEPETTEKERKPREKKENPLRPVFKDWVTEMAERYGFTLKTWEKHPHLWQIKGEKTVAEIRWGLKGWMVNCKQLTADVANAPYYLQKGYSLPAVIKLQYNSLGKDVFENILIQTAE